MAFDIRDRREISLLEAENTQLKSLVSILAEENQRLQQMSRVFPLMRLPAELRVGIWTAMVSKPRIIRIRKVNRKLQFVCSSPPPVTLQICGESREHTLRTFKRFHLRSENTRGSVYFRQDIDTIFLDVTNGALEFAWQHPEMSQSHAIAMNKKALENIRSSALLHSDIRWITFVNSVKSLMTTNRMPDPSHCCPDLRIVQGSAKRWEDENLQRWIGSFRGSVVQIQSVKITCGCISRFRTGQR